ncbi:acyl carrier protein [Paenibacillus kobensis]|uniref:acyl carrier protein n=1 Tax=Paenibacillus kobensis TaxID=59841 RepID=UPI0013E3BB2C|nr:acyl carrier protein [Paenibacillus kobensis]
MNELDIVQFVIERVADLTSRPELAEELNGDSSLEDAGVDSVLLVNLMIQIEQQYDIFFEDDELLQENFATARVISQRILAKRAAITEV